LCAGRGQKQPNGRVAGREKYLGNRHREVAVNQKIELFEDVADRRRDHHSEDRRSLWPSAARQGIGSHIAFP
jgi:hypothetical protein